MVPAVCLDVAATGRHLSPGGGGGGSGHVVGGRCEGG